MLQYHTINDVINYIICTLRQQVTIDMLSMKQDKAVT